MTDSQSNSKVFSVRIVSIDFHMAPPIPDLDICYSSFQGGKVNEVPVIRIYGSTPAGQKTCLHVHRALPYLYVPCSDISFNPPQEGDAYMHAISLALEKALKLKGNVASKRQHVHDCSLVRAKRFYGYHGSEELFVKIYLYYPHDVARAASLLLGGAVLDKSLQPYESHIPFVLQFLIDYNLSGMGYIHLSQMKFRHPVPNVFSPRNLDFKSFQADPSDGASFGFPVWISSTIPRDWMWHLSDEFDALKDSQLHHLKRQSACGLEGDATVEDIVNQQFKMYDSLSQIGSGVKMVQSLIPIWEEEYERTGIQEPPIPPDSGKPLPRDVLKTLSLDLEFENKFLELCNEAEEILILSQSDVNPVQSMASSTDEENLSALAHVNPESTNLHPLHCSRESTQGLQCENEMGGAGSEGKDACLKSSSANEVKSFEMIDSLDHKAEDMEALGLLKWLASSQAAEDINSDDELVRETILGPLLPATTIDKVLEKANMDYESESQKECQDILDSIEDFVDFGAMKERASSNVFPIDHLQASADEKIPQLDGSSDDPHSSPLAGSIENSLKFDTKTESKEITQQHDTNKSNTRICSSPSGEHVNTDVSDVKVSNTLTGCSVRDLMRRKRYNKFEPPEWEPVKVKKTLAEKEKKENARPEDNMHEKLSLHSLDFRSSFSHHEAGVSETGTCRSTYLELSIQDRVSFPFRSHSTSHAGAPSSTEKNEAQWTSNPKTKQDSDFRVRFAGSTNSDVYCIKSASSSGVEQLEFNTKDKPLIEEGVQEIDAIGSSCFMPFHQKTLDEDTCFQNHAQEAKKCMELTYDVPDNKLKDIDMTVDTRTCNVEQPMDTHLSGLHCPLHMSSNMTEDSDSLIGLTLRKKPPTSDEGFVVSEKDSYLPAIPFQDSHVDEKDYKGILGRSVDEILPFFEGDLGGKEVQNNCLENMKCDNVNQEAVMGVPTHYQNDGSCLYLLTSVFSPPSADCVSKWLLQHAEGVSEEVDTVPEPLPLKGPLHDDCKKAMIEFGFMSHLRAIKPVLKENNGVFIAQSISYSTKISVLQNEGDVVKINANVDGSQDISQISGPDGKSRPTPLSQIGFRDPASVGAGQQLTLLSIEVQAESRGDLRPDPRVDAINVVALAIQNDHDLAIEVYVLLCTKTVCSLRNVDGISGCKILAFSEERHLFTQFVDILCSFDPDILMGWDIQGGSLGFLAERAAQLGIGLLKNISRIAPETTVATGVMETPGNGIPNNVEAALLIADPVQLEEAIIEDEWGRTHGSGVHVGGRIVLNVWRLMRAEIKLNMYTIEAVAEAVLRRKIPSIPHKVLNRWFLSGPGSARYRCIEYVIKRVKLNLEILNQLDLINRTSELARVFGIDFFSVLSRGSQYRVESMFLRLAHTQNYLAISPGNSQVASQPAMECLPLVMEPESCFYTDPVVVLDFQSLYPSMIIAYNLCFCTCLGKVVPSQENTLGVSSFSLDPHVLLDLKNQLQLTPNGVMYVPSKLRKGVLPRLLEEILSTRIMLKQAMKKLAPSQQVLQRIFNARQLALKLIANVTYGYTAAGFSGRMPCAELADSIVQCGRRTLEKAISFVNANNRWKAKVVYGDTDSMFVLLKGRTVKEAFQIGQEIVSAVTAMNPNPVALKMEKVYHPCFLLTKKRYVGYSYESPDQIEPLFDAKGIETVRRDTCEAVSKTMEQSLRLFFEHQDISEVKAYLQRQWKRILSGRVSFQDFVLAKEVRLGTYSSRASSLLPPAAIVAMKLMRADPRAEPRYAERVPYVVIHGEPGARLVDMVVDPLDLLVIDSPYRLNDLYYINKQIIPALQRVFGLVGADLNMWFSEMPRPARDSFSKRPLHAPNPSRTRIDYYYLSKHCILCGDLVQASAHLCNKCLQNGSAAAAAVTGRTSKLERDMHCISAICRHCGGGDWLIESGIKCNNLVCSMFYERLKVQKELQALSTVATDKGFYPKCMIEWF